jgi:hypothetical protein
MNKEQTRNKKTPTEKKNLASHQAWLNYKRERNASQEDKIMIKKLNQSLIESRLDYKDSVK